MFNFLVQIMLKALRMLFECSLLFWFLHDVSADDIGFYSEVLAIDHTCYVMVMLYLPNFKSITFPFQYQMSGAEEHCKV